MMIIVVMMVGRHNGWLLVSGIYELCSLTHTDAIFHSLSLSYMAGDEDEDKR